MSYSNNLTKTFKVYIRAEIPKLFTGHPILENFLNLVTQTY